MGTYQRVSDATAERVRNFLRSENKQLRKVGRQTKEGYGLDWGISFDSAIEMLLEKVGF